MSDRSAFQSTRNFSSPMNLDVVLSAIDAIYETTSDPNRWPAALFKIAECFDASGTVLFTEREDHSFATVASPRLERANEAYQAGWWKEDFLTFRAREYGFVYGKDAFRDVDLSSEAERKTHPFYTGFRQTFGLGGVLAGSISPMPGTMVAIAVQGRLAAPAFTEADTTLLVRLMQHCERALVLTGRMEQQQLHSINLETLLSRVGCGILVVDQSSKVTHGNAAAEAMLHKELQIVGGRLTVRGQTSTRQSPRRCAIRRKTGSPARAP